MLKHIVTLSLLLLAGGTLFAGDTRFHRGGVTFPMEKISAERFAVKSVPAGKNLIKNSDFTRDFVPSKNKLNGWCKGRWMFGEENRKKFFAKAVKLTETKISTVDGKKVLDLNRPAELEKLMGAQTPNIYISAEQRIPLPDAQGGIYKFTFQYKTQKIGSTNSNRCVLIYYYSEIEKGKNTRSYQAVYFPVSPVWTNHSVELTVPAGTKALNIGFRGTGCGRALITNAVLVKADKGKFPVEIEVTPMKMLDNVYVLASGDPGILAMRLRNTLPKGAFKERSVSLEMTLPAEVELLGANGSFASAYTSKDMIIKGKKYKKWLLDFTAAMPAHFRSSNSFTGWNIPAVMLRSNAKPGTQWDCFLTVTAKGKAVSAAEKFTIRMDAPLFKVPLAKLFLPGFSSVSGDIQFRSSAAARDAFVKFVTSKSGTRWITASMPLEDSRLFKKHGVKYITSEPWAIANGYRVGRLPKEKKPEYTFFRDLLGRPVGNHGIYATCPAAIYQKTPYYKETVVPYIRKTLAEGLDGFTPNWEPYTFRNMGCFCDVCKKEFASYAKIPADKIDAVWPKELQLGRPYREKAIAFRGWQHGKMVMTLHEEIIASGGSGVGMCPEVGTDQIIKYPQHNAQQGEYSPYNYAGQTKWLNVWGPYIWFIGERPYVYSKAAYLRFWETLRRCVRDYRNELKTSRAKLLAMPHGNQVSTTALGQPEGMAMDQISAFLAGFDASQLYFFPRGYDHRFWRELGRSSRLIALTEDLVMTGKKLDTVKVLPVTPFPAPVTNISPRLIPDLKRSDILQAAAFAKGKKILAAVGNFWEKGDVIFKLQLPGLKAKQTYSVIEIPFNRQFTKEQGKLFTGKDLQQGILLHAGALRWVFFEITECAAPPAVAQLTAADLAKEKLRLDKANTPAAVQEAARDKALLSEQDFGEWKNMTASGISCKVIDPQNKNLLQITAGKNSLLLNPRGLVIDSWKVNGTEQAAANFAMTCFWSPGKNGMQSYNAYKVTEQKMTPQGLRITGVCTTSGRTYPAMAGAQFKRVLTFAKDLKSVTVECFVTNPSEFDIGGVGFRWYFMPAAWNNANGGHMEIGPQKITRPHGYSFYKKEIDSVSEATIRRIFLVKSPSILLKSNSNQLSFKSAKTQTLTVTLHPAARFGGVAVWDTPDLFAATCEPFYQPVTIPPGGTVSYKAELKVR